MPVMRLVDVLNSEIAPVTDITPFNMLSCMVVKIRDVCYITVVYKDSRTTSWSSLYALG